MYSEKDDGDEKVVYHSDMFQTLHYSDLKDSHTNSVLPGFEYRHYNSIEELVRERQDETPYDNETSLQILNSKKRTMEENATQRAYYYAKKTQEAEEENRIFLARMKLLKC